MQKTSLPSKAAEQTRRQNCVYRTRKSKQKKKLGKQQKTTKKMKRDKRRHRGRETTRKMKKRRDMRRRRGRTWLRSTRPLKMKPGWRSCRKVSRCMRSFSASSSSVWIQPLSRLMLRRDFMWRSIPPTIPGTPVAMHVCNNSVPSVCNIFVIYACDNIVMRVCYIALMRVCQQFYSVRV